MRILHINGFRKTLNYTYRRKKLNDFLIKKFGEESITSFCTKDDDISKLSDTYDICIFSSVRYASTVIKYIENKNIRIYYDRTDRWSAPDAQGNIMELRENELWLFEKSEKIFISSIKLLDDIPDIYKSKVYYIPNGCTLLPYKSLSNKYINTIAIVGRNLRKVDTDFIFNLAVTNQDWNFNFYGFSKDEFIKNNVLLLPNYNLFDRLSEEDLHNELCKCQLGLVSFKASDWTSGMLPLKLFNYANAHIPTLYHNCPSITDYYKDIAIECNDNIILSSIDTSIFKYDKILNESDWSIKFEKMMELINV